MMDCKIIQDLLPLYADGCCSEETKQVVEEHLKTCADCRDMLAEMTGQLPAPEAAPLERESAQTMKKGMKKVRRRWLTSLLAVILLIPVIKIGWNQFQGTGLHPTNLNEYRICTAFLRDLTQDDYEGAFRRFDLDDIRRDWTVWAFPDEQMAALESNGLAMFLKSTTALKEAGLTDYRYLNAYENDESCTFYFAVTVGNTEEKLNITVNDQGIEYVLGGNGYLPAPDALTQMSLWREYLWQDYSGCYFDPEQGAYIYGENQ